MAEYGSGIYLTRTFDFDVDGTGDIRLSRGLDELQKDVAFFQTLALRPELGEPRYNEVLNRIDIRAREMLLADPRIDSVLDLTVREPNDRHDTVEVVALVRAGDEEQELVFEVER